MQLTNSIATRRNRDPHKDIHSLYTLLASSFEKLMNQLKIGYEDDTKRRHKISFHSMRRAFKSMLANLTNTDFSEWALNHRGSPYYQVSEADKYKIFKKIESEITFLDQAIITEKHADIQSQLDTMKKENQELRDNIHKIMEMIQENPKLARVKPEVLVKKQNRIK